MVPQPTTKKLSSTRKSAFIIFHSPTTDFKRRANQVSFETLLSLKLAGTKGPACIFLSIDIEPRFEKKKLERQGKSKNYGIWLWLQFETWGTFDRGGWNGINKEWDPKHLVTFKRDHGMLPPFHGSMMGGLFLVWRLWWYLVVVRGKLPWLVRWAWCKEPLIEETAWQHQHFPPLA